jgi:hypothetical protein
MYGDVHWCLMPLSDASKWNVPTVFGWLADKVSSITYRGCHGCSPPPVMCAKALTFISFIRGNNSFTYILVGVKRASPENQITLSLQLPQPSVPITTIGVSLNPTRPIQHYVIKFVCNLWQACGFLLVLRFPPPINLTACNGAHLIS